MVFTCNQHKESRSCKRNSDAAPAAAGCISCSRVLFLTQHPLESVSGRVEFIVSSNTRARFAPIAALPEQRISSLESERGAPEARQFFGVSTLALCLSLPESRRYSGESILGVGGQATCTWLLNQVSRPCFRIRPPILAGSTLALVLVWRSPEGLWVVSGCFGLLVVVLMGHCHGLCGAFSLFGDLCWYLQAHLSTHCPKVRLGPENLPTDAFLRRHVRQRRDLVLGSCEFQGFRG